MPSPITPKQKRVLDAIRLYVKTRETTPSVRDLAALTRSAVGTVHEHLHTLERKGWIVVDGTSHGIQLLTSSGDATALVEVPITDALPGDGRRVAHSGPAESIQLPHSLVGKRAFAVRVVGDAFGRVHILDADLLVFNPTSHCRANDIVLVDRPPTGPTLEQVRHAGSRPRLLPMLCGGAPAAVPKHRIRGRLIALLRHFRP